MKTTNDAETKNKTGKSLVAKWLSTALTVVVVVAAIGLAYTFPSNLVLHLFQEKVGQDQIDALQYDYGQLAGLPAGEGVTVVQEIGQLDGMDYQGYFTFETKSIIPLDLYRLKSTADQVTTSGSGRRTVRRQRPVYTTGGFLVENVYNRYYLVQLPDGNYIMSYLDDSYYVKYLLTGRVQLPLGRIDGRSRDVERYLAEEIEEYSLEDGKMLNMFAEEEYEEHKIWHQAVSIGVFFVVLALYVAVISGVSALFRRRG